MIVTSQEHADTVATMPTLFAVDGNSLLYRAFYGIPDTLTTPDGAPSNALFGFASMLLRLTQYQPPDAAFVAWDTPEPTFRTAAFPDYKAGRSGPPEHLISQFAAARDLVDVLGYTQMAEAGFEADDLLATAATNASACGHDTFVVTGDRDSFQLVRDRQGDRGAVIVLYPRSGTSQLVHVNSAWVQEHYRVRPSTYPEFAALRGDPSDNLKGAAGIGPVIAAKLLETYGSLEDILAHTDDLTPAKRAGLNEAADRVRRNLALTRLITDIPTVPDISEMEYQPRIAEARRMFTTLGFASLMPMLTD